MRWIALTLLASIANVAAANTTPDLSPAPAWVVPSRLSIPHEKTAAPVRLILVDEQVSLSPGSVARYAETAILVQTAAGLAAGNVALSWRPDIDTLAVHKLNILRGNQTIDVLRSGQKFTVIRREPNLAAAMLDGRLTATLQIDGLQVGDVIDLAMSIVTRDPTFGRHVETAIASWNGAAIDHAHARLHWTNDIPLRLRANADLAQPRPISDATGKSIEITLHNVQPIMFPRGAPPRFAIGRLIEATDFRSWNDLAALEMPLYVKASAIDPRGDVARQADTIAAASADPATRAGAALALVQNNIRYLALAMGTGGYVPIAADATWASRLGDCKAKTALLLAILHRLKITAVPVLVSTQSGDGIDSRLPMIGLFDHVLVRATIGGKDYWLDGTRTGDRDVAKLEIPNFHWGLPLVANNAQLVAMRPLPRAQPDNDYNLQIDARGGIFAPAPAHAELIYRGDTAQLSKLLLETLPEATRDAQLREFWKERYPFIEPAKVGAAFDPITGVEKLWLDGTARLNWEDGFLRIPGSSLAHEADFSRPKGPDADAPFATAYPSFSRATAAIQLPPGVTLWPGDVGHDVDQKLAGVEHRREAKIVDNVLRMTKTERVLVPEISAIEARQAQAKLRAIYDEDVHLRKGKYRATDADLVELAKAEPSGASEYLDRGLLFLDRGRLKDAIADFTKAHELAPKDVWPLANRGLARAHLNELAEAEADFAAAAAIDPSNAVVARGRAVASMNRGDRKGAIAALTASLQKEPGNQFALLARARLYNDFGDHAAALADIDTIFKRNPKDIDSRLLRATIYRNLQKNELALVEAEWLEREIPADSYAQAAAASIYGALGNTSRALALLSAAIAAKPNTMLYLNRAVLREENDLAGRRSDLEAALKLDPTNVAALEAMGIFALDHDEHQRAISAFGELLGKYPEAPMLLTYRGLAYARAGNADAAQRDFAAASRIAKSPEDFNAMCWGKAIRGIALELALKDCNRAINAKPDMASFLDSRAFVYLKLGRLKESIADYDAALKLAPKLAASLYGRSSAHLRVGDVAKAKSDRDAAEQVSPGIAARFEKYGITRP